MPFLRYAHYASLLLLLLIVFSVALPASFPAWLGQLASGLAILVSLAFLINLGLMIRDWREGQLFIVRNATFYSGLLSLLILVWLLFKTQSNPGLFSGLEWWLAPLLLFHYSQQLSYVRLDAVRLDIKLGLGKAESIALFQISSLSISMTSVEARLTDGRSYTLLRSYFSKNRWQLLTNELEKVRQNLTDA